MKHRISVRVLVLDDDDALVRRVRGWLEEAGFEVLAYRTAAEALPALERVACAAALVDLNLGEADGATVIAAVRAAAPTTRIVALAAFPDVATVLAAVRAGANDVLEKPLQPGALLAALERQLAQIGLGARGEDDFNARLGARLRQVRQEQGLTLGSVAEAAGLSAAALSQIELGRSATSTWTLARICMALRMPLARVCDGV